MLWPAFLTQEADEMRTRLQDRQAQLTGMLASLEELHEQLQKQGLDKQALVGTAAQAQAAYSTATQELETTHIRIQEAQAAVSGADSAYRAAREALLAAQKRLSEALQISGALSQHVREVRM
jgi:iron uptake system EfeUOB component EfeO/EfeM